MERENSSMQDHPVFPRLQMCPLTETDFDAEIAGQGDALVGVFFWGHDCPNCDVAKAMLLQEARDVEALGLTWFHVNAYEERDLATRFGLFGIPAFFFFHRGKKLGRISPFPGMEPFLTALRELKKKTGPA